MGRAGQICGQKFDTAKQTEIQGRRTPGVKRGEKATLKRSSKTLKKIISSIIKKNNLLYFYSNPLSKLSKIKKNLQLPLFDFSESDFKAYLARF